MRDLPVGNGSLLVNFDDKYQIRDIYFPHVGQENHTEGFPFRFGVFADDMFSWVFSDDWTRELKYLPDTLVTDVVLKCPRMELEIRCNDTVCSTENVFLRRITVRNTSASARRVRVFLHHDFRIYENKVGDTAFFDPGSMSLVHYKKHRYFLINTEPAFNEFATGRKAFHNSEGTWRDAEDGSLGGAAITEGSVDSTIGIHLFVEAGAETEFFCWIAAGTSLASVSHLNEQVRTRGPLNYLLDARQYWHQWLGSPELPPEALSHKVRDLYCRSLLIIRTQTDDLGAIVAATDHDVTERATDHYSYLWPRDGAFVANALDVAGYHEIAGRFFELCSQIVDARGYFVQKYNPDGSVGSGWHAHWDSYHKRAMVPIQEDETALVIWALYEHIRLGGRTESAERWFREMVVPCSNFMCDFRDPSSGLPLPSWNLWEDRHGVHTFTCATVFAGLKAAAAMAEMFGRADLQLRYETAAEEIAAGMRTHLYSTEHARFLRGLLTSGDDLVPDPIVDASLFGVFYFGCFAVDDPLVVSTMSAIETALLNQTTYSGVARFESDGYMRGPDDAPPNSWIISTLWLAEYYIGAARSRDDLAKALAILEWTADRALPSGVLPEQIDPWTGEQRSVSPLTWSHSTYVATVRSYLSRLSALS